MSKQNEIVNDIGIWIEKMRQQCTAASMTGNFEQKLNLHLELLSKISELNTFKEKLKCCEVNELLKSCENESFELPTFVVAQLVEYGMEAYSKKDFETAEKAFYIAAKNNSNNARNNYAYMVRRKEASHCDNKAIIASVKSLYPILKEWDSFAVVNVALTFALCYGEDKDWHLSDELMKNLSAYKVSGVSSWWKDVAAQGDIEGDLVHYFLLRHNKIDESELGSLKSLSRRIRKNIPGLPGWICEDSDFDSLDDVFDAFDDVDFFELLDEYLNNMPCNRNSVDEILEKIEIFDILDLYQTVLDYDFRTLLTNEEIHKLVKDYKEKFSAELPFDIDEI